MGFQKLFILVLNFWENFQCFWFKQINKMLNEREILEISKLLTEMSWEFLPTWTFNGRCMWTLRHARSVIIVKTMSSWMPLASKTISKTSVHNVDSLHCNATRMSIFALYPSWTCNSRANLRGPWIHPPKINSTSKI